MLFGKGRGSLQGCKPTPTLTTSIAVWDQPSIEEGLAYLHDGMVQNPITKGWGGDRSLLGIMNDKLSETCQANSLTLQLCLQLAQVLIQISFE